MACNQMWGVGFLVLSCILNAGIILGQELPTNLGYYTEGGVTSGVDERPDGFFLNGKNITILSGAMHYFRIHPDYWRDRLRKLRAGGANAVETYVPWNLHEPSPGKFDFGNGTGDMSPFLDVVKYIKTAQEEDLLVIVRPGPYICAEWEYGGMPSWLLRDREMKIRSSDPKFEERVRIYFSHLLPLLANLQFTLGGPIIAFQIENEYGNVKFGNEPIDQQYLIDLHQMMKSLGLKEMFFTADTPTGSGAAESYVPSVLRTANFNKNPETQLNKLKQQQPNKPLMVMEYWTGWFDRWMAQSHSTVSVAEYTDVLERILKFPSSANLYMYHGGTNWGFLNGANVDNTYPYYAAHTTSYDYDAPLTEAGDYTEKYTATQTLFAQYSAVETKLPEKPEESVKMAYPSAPVTGQLNLDAIVDQIPESEKFSRYDVINMEELDMNDGAGQQYGYILYRKPSVAFATSSVLKISGKVHGIATVVVDGVTKTPPLISTDQLGDFGFWIASDEELAIESSTAGAKQLDILVENFGRNNFGNLYEFDERKGLYDGPVLVDDEELHSWEIIPLEFKGDWVRSLTNWGAVSASTSPTLYQATFEVTEPHDTFLDMRTWGKGVVFINGFNLGRYLQLGPTRTLYLPAPLLKTGQNQIVIFEQVRPASSVVFTDKPILQNRRRHPHILKPLMEFSLDH